MNKFCIFLFPLLAFTELSVAQNNVTATVGTAYPDVNFGKLFSSVDQTGMLNIGRLDKTIVLQKIGPDLAQKKVMQYENFPKDFKVEQIILLKGKCFMFYSAPTKSHLNLFVAQIDVVKGELLDGGKEIVSPSDKIDDDFVKGHPFDILFSSDSGLFAICYKIKSGLNKSKNGEVNGVWTFDSKLAERWHAEFVLPYNERKTKVLDRAIDVNGNIHFALRVIKDESGMEKKLDQTVPNYSIELLSYRSPSEAPKVKNFDLNDKFLNNLSLDIVKDNLICSGFYNSKGSEDEAEGIFVADVSSQQASKTSFHSFSLSFMNEGEKSNKQKSNEKLLAKGKTLALDLRLIRTIPQADGGILLLGNQHDVVTQYTPGTGVGGGGGSVNTIHLYFNLIVARLLPDGSLGWIRKLLMDADATSFEYYLKDDIHCFLFVEKQDLIGYRLNNATGQGDRNELLKLKPLLKRPHAFFTSRIGYPTQLPERNGVVLTASLSGDAGRFGETKPYKEEVVVKVLID